MSRANLAAIRRFANFVVVCVAANGIQTTRKGQDRFFHHAKNTVRNLRCP